MTHGRDSANDPRHEPPAPKPPTAAEQISELQAQVLALRAALRLLLLKDDTPAQTRFTKASGPTITELADAAHLPPAVVERAKRELTALAHFGHPKGKADQWKAPLAPPGRKP